MSPQVSDVLGAESCPEFQAQAALTQAAPVQNTYYTVLDVEGKGFLYAVAAGVDTADETLDVVITIDGVVITSTGLACTAAADYNCYLYCDTSSERYETALVAQSPQNRQINLPFKRSCKVEVRKTTAGGAGDLHGFVLYGMF